MRKVKQSKTKRNIILIITAIFCLSIIGYAVYESLSTEDIYSIIEEKPGQITYFTRFGTTLNIQGELVGIPNVEELTEINLVLKTLEEEHNLPIKYSLIGNSVYFTTSNLINDGINLDNLPVGDWLMLLKLSYNEEDVSYYSLSNKTTYSGFSYYTITHNNQNNLVALDFINHIYDEGKTDERSLEVTTLKIETATLPNNVYDFAIEVGHGGDDPGAVGYLNGEEITEFSINLDIALKIKELLTSAGYKVILTHESNINLPAYGSYARATIANDVSAKYCFSIHSNSHVQNIYVGTEIYAPINADYTFAKLLSDKIVEMGSGKISNLDYNTPFYFSPIQGVFVRTFNDENVKNTNDEIAQLGATAYETLQALKTNYYYMIREVGGISTGAYVDGRNPEYEKNSHYNSNNTAEPIIIELNYVNNSEGLTSLLDNPDGYANGIFTAVDEYVNSLHN